MKVINTEFNHLAFAEIKMETNKFWETLMSLERQVFEDGLYKNGPVLVETNLSTFAKPGFFQYKFYIPVNEKFKSNDELTYIKK